MKSQMEEVLKNLQILSSGHNENDNDSGSHGNWNLNREDTGGRHNCKNKQLFMFEVVEGEEGVQYQTNEISVESLDADIDPQISLHDITGVPSYSTMKIVRAIGTKPLQILINSGSTHSFLNDKLADKLKCATQTVKNMPGRQTDPNLKELLSQLMQGVVIPNRSWNDQILSRKNKIAIAQDTNIRNDIIHICHSSPTRGHSVYKPTLLKAQQMFYWKGCNKEVHRELIWHFLAPITLNLVLNHCLESYLRSMSMDAPLQWVKWLPLAQWLYNTTFHSAIKISPYEALFGIKPPIHIPYTPGDTQVAAVEELHRDREAMIKQLKFNLEKARNRMQQQVNSKCIDRSFKAGDWVYLKLQPFVQKSLKLHSNQKLSPRYFGPYLVLERIGSCAYKLDLLPDSSIHPTFHVSLLKPAYGSAAPTIPLPTAPRFQLQPHAIIDRKIVQKGHKAVLKVLVHRENLSLAEATWEPFEDFKLCFPQFDC
ncbi:hypothetical protein E3N88_34924 [Mikania micrantha]|uniref:Uncharacterized protein n=1 Tax=Mikania micrantha TaxID=192012 RepID=A0A5N6LZJ1_9ASTR|nr:hypothetical protein E3N88_34924 [Mikania micrantha]